MRIKIPAILIALVYVLTSCQSTPTPDEAFATIKSSGILENISALSADSMLGRAAGSPGEIKTVNYIVQQYKKIGLAPGMPDGSYIQKVPVTGQITSRDANIILKMGNNVIKTLQYQTDFMAWPTGKREAVDIQNAPLIYVGYGIQAPEENWDDFKGIDVKGKILVVKNDDPSNIPGLFGGKTRLYYGRYGYKYETAAKLGALGVLIIHTTQTAGYPWSVVANGWSSEQFALNDDIQNESKTEFDGWLTQNVSAQLFRMAGLDLAEQLNNAESRDFKPVPLKNIKLSVSLKATYRKLDIQNVVGVLEGSDPILNEESVIFTAHHDHLGTGTPVNGDSIYNGAIDNASGVSAMLNLAKAYKLIQPRLRRSLIFLAVSGEEKGLLGSDYYAKHPTVSPGKMSAVINVDEMNVWGPTKDMVYVGYGRSDIDTLLNNVAKKYNRIIKPDQFPSEGHFYRSDQFSFAKIGVPAFYPNVGTDFIDKPKDYGKKVWDNFVNNIYHTPFDEINPDWDLSGMISDMQVIYHLGIDISNADKIRSWNHGDEFEKERKIAIESINEAAI